MQLASGPYGVVRQWETRARHLSRYLSSADLPNWWAELSPQTQSDCVRLALLARHGGVWMDVSILTCASVEDLGWAAIESGAKDASAVFHPESRAGRGGSQGA